MALQTIHIEAELPWRLESTAKGVLVTCEPLALVLEADDESEARSLIPEGLHNFFAVHWEAHSLSDFLDTKGWAFYIDLSPGDGVRFHVRWRLC
jgi:hypothetical protein